MRNRFQQTLALYFGTAVGALVIVCMIAHRNAIDYAAANVWVGHTYEVLDRLHSAASHLRVAEASPGGLLITGDPVYQYHFDESVAEIGPTLARLTDLTSDNPSQQKRLRQLAVSIRSGLDVLRESIALYRINDLEAATTVFRSKRGKRLMDEAHRLLAVAEQAERTLLEERNQRSRSASRTSAKILVGLAAVAVLSLAASYAIVGREVSRRKRAEEASRCLSEGLERKVEERTQELTRAADRLRLADVDRRYLATIVDSSHDAIVGKDLDGNVTSWNLGAKRLFGYTAAEMAGRSVILLIPPDRKAEEAVILERLRNGESLEHFETVRLTKDGRSIDVSLTISPIRDSSDRIIGVSKIARDITAKKEAETAIRELNADLEHRVELRTAELVCAKEAAESATRAKGEFLANVSHELRTPMNAIMGMTELTLDTPLSPSQRENLEIVKSATDSLLTLIEDLLDFSRIEAGRIQLDPMPFELRELLEEIVSMLAPRAHIKGIELGLHVHPTVPDQLIGDSGRLRQILVNLVGNAIKFTEEGEVVVEVERSNCADKSVELQFRVIDTGIGISAEHHAMIFRPFVQADGSTTRLYGGTGLGLSIATQLVELMGGQVSLESEFGHGSEFRFTAQFVADSSERCPQLTTLQSLQNVRTLVVDDNAVNRRILGEMLRNWGMQVTLASGGKEALIVLKEAKRDGMPFALIILDAQMPDMDGFTVAQRIRDDPAYGGVVIFMLTSINKEMMIESCRLLGISTYLHKPIRQNELRKTLMRIVDPAAAIEPAPVVPRPASPEKTPQSLRILVAEDNPLNQRVVSLMLAKEGHMTTIGNNGREAVAIWRRELFDLMLMDVQMPEMDGLQATAAIRAAEVGTGNHVPIIAMTAYARKEDRSRCVAAGMDGYVSKPVKAAELHAAIEDCLSLVTSLRGGPSSEESILVWDLDAALARVNGDRPFLREMASMLLKELPGRMGEIRDAIVAAEPSKIGEPAHTLKNWFDNFAARRAAEMIQELEELGHQDNVSGATMAFEALELETSRLYQALERFSAVQDTLVNSAFSS